MRRIDMSPEALTLRLRQVDELRELCLALAGSRLKRPQGADSGPEHRPASLVRPNREKSDEFQSGLKRSDRGMETDNSES